MLDTNYCRLISLRLIGSWAGVELGTSVLQIDIVGCHGENGGSCWDPGEGATGAGDVDVGVRQGLVRVHTELFWGTNTVPMG